VKLVRQVILQFVGGSSRKAYEVDLCEVGEGEYVVNFRYGRIGTNLRDGTKTAAPVSRARAEKVFDDLVASKVKKGYAEAGDGSPAAPVADEAPPAPTAASTRQRELAVVEQLRAAARGDSGRPLARLVFRAGELRIAEATPTLLEVLAAAQAPADKSAPTRPPRLRLVRSERPTDGAAPPAGADASFVLRWSLFWALGRCGDPSAVPVLEAALEGVDFGALDALSRAAAEALRAVADEPARERFGARVREALPGSLLAEIDKGDEARASEVLRAHLAADTRAAWSVVEPLYLLDDETAQATVLTLAREAPLRPPAFQRVRRLFKAAEQRGDWRLFGALAHRFEKTPAMYRKPEWGAWADIGGQYLDLREELGKPDPRVAYSSATRRFLRKRVWRTLRRLGEAGDPEYVRAAVGVLLPYSDDDAQNVRRSAIWDWDEQRSQEAHFDRFAAYWPLNHVLYRHSPRYYLKANGAAFRCRPTYSPGDPAPDVREEAFPGLWDEEPRGLVHLLMDSACTPVLEHAARALRANRGFAVTLPVAALRELLVRPFEIVARLAWDLVKDRWDPAAPDVELVLAVLDCTLDDARAAARGWVDAARATLVNDSLFLARVITSPRADTRALGRELLAGATLPEDVAQAVIARVFAALFALGDDGEGANELARDAGDALLRGLPEALATIDLKVVLDLCEHSLEQVQVFGAQLALGHDKAPAGLPDGLIAELMNASFASVRTIGVRIFGTFPDEVLAERVGLLRDLCTSPLVDVRAAVRPIVGRLASANPELGADLATLLVGRLLKKEPAEGVHKDLLELLRAELEDAVGHVSQHVVWRLLRARSTAAQEMGGVLLGKNVDPADVEVRKMAGLLSHDVLTVREAGEGMLAASRERLRANVGDASRALDAKWEDARRWAFDFFREAFGAEHWTPRALVAVCDSPREDVQSFGKELITRFFEDDHGTEYLQKLSEHPNASLQLFATNYLSRFARDSVERLEQLEPYFVTVLSGVNKGRVAKQRVLRFLHDEGARSADAARVVARILTRQSVTIAIGDKAACIETMIALQAKYPELEVPLSQKAFETRAPRYGVARGV
jgi:predicted DNA-binding WGR domain protein